GGADRGRGAPGSGGAGRDPRQPHLPLCRSDRVHGGRADRPGGSTPEGGRMKQFVIPLIAALTLAFAVVHIVRARTPRDILPPPEPPASSTFTEAVGAVGLVEASSENIALSTPVPGLVTAVLVKAGDRVTAGQPLFTLDDRDLRAELGVRRAALDVARQHL